MQHHAFVIQAVREEGIACAHHWIEEHLGMSRAGNPDVLVQSYGLLSVEDARTISDVASSAPFTGEYKAVIIAADRAYHEAQNALLKLFEEPPPGTFLFLVLPSLGGLLPTLRSRVQELKTERVYGGGRIPEATEEFLRAGKERRTAILKRLTSGKDEDERRENREEAIALLNGIEAAAYPKRANAAVAALLKDVAVLRGHLYDRSAPVKMILEHCSLVVPRSLL